MKKRFAMFLAVVMAAGVLAGCGSSPSSAAASDDATQTTGTDKLVIWTYMNEGEPMATWEQSVVDLYVEEYPDVDVEIVFCGR